MKNSSKESFTAFVRLISVGICEGRCGHQLKFSITAQFRGGRRFPTLLNLFFHGGGTRHLKVKQEIYPGFR